MAELIGIGWRLESDSSGGMDRNRVATCAGIRTFVREPEGNGCAERFVRILKENLLWVKTFATVEELRVALQEFRRIYNETWIIERHGYKTPAQIRREQRGLVIKAA